jgi:pimeloyl-ACP methyl ester carboxylesterase
MQTRSLGRSSLEGALRFGVWTSARSGECLRQITIIFQVRSISMLTMVFATAPLGLIVVIPIVVYGDRDWSLAEERRRTVAAIPVARVETVPGAGHFLSLDQPERLAEIIVGFA